MGLQPDRLVKVRDGFLVAAEVALRGATVVVGFGGVGFQPDRLVMVSDGFLMTTEVVFGDASVAVGFREVRLQPDRLVVRIYCCIKGVLAVFLA